MRTLSLLAIVVSAAAAAGCGSDTTAPPADPAPSLSLTVAPSLATIRGGETIALQARVVYPDGSAAQPGGVAWRSLDTRIATIRPGGIVQGDQAGEALILAVWGDMQASARVVVVTRSPNACVEALVARVGPGGSKEDKSCQ